MKNFILIAVLLLVGISYGQNYTYPVGLYNYDSLTGVYVPSEEVKTSKKEAKKQSSAYPSGGYSYEALSALRTYEAEVVANRKSKKDVYAAAVKKETEKSRKNIVIRKAKTEVLVRYNGDYSSIKLVDGEGNKVKASFSTKYKGLIVPRAKETKSYFLEVVKDGASSKVYYHQVSL